MHKPWIIAGSRGTVLVLVATSLTAACHHSPRGRDAGPTAREVMVGYGSQEREDVTGAVSSLTADDVAHRKYATVEEMIEGRFPGVQVVRHSGGITLRIRGLSTLTGNSEPLFVIDGMPISAAPGRALVGISPADVERIDILKDAGSTSIYGSRGANGVVLITTKRAR